MTVGTGPVGIEMSGNLGHKYRTLFESSRRPHLKLLVGDQVYLDTPLQHLILPMSRNRIKRHISRTYWYTWSKLGWFLSHGANICSSDDHEFWNDYPYRQPQLPALARRPSADTWKEQARDFLRWIQVAPPPKLPALTPGNTFTIGKEEPELSFYIADTRINRVQAEGETPAEFMNAKDFRDLISWITGLSCPGVLVMGQPLLSEAESTAKRWFDKYAGNRPNSKLVQRVVGWLGKQADRLVVTDRNLPYFTEQYAQLCQALIVAAHDVLVLSGDVHFGRVAEITRAWVDDRRPTRVFEVVSSPMALLAHAPGSFSIAEQDIPERLRSFPFPGAEQQYFVPGEVDIGAHVRYRRVVRNVKKAKDPTCEDHYMTLEFVKIPDGGGIRVTVIAHLLKIPTSLDQPATEDWTDEFVLDEGYAAAPASARAVSG